MVSANIWSRLEKQVRSSKRNGTQIIVPVNGERSKVKGETAVLTVFLYVAGEYVANWLFLQNIRAANGLAIHAVGQLHHRLKAFAGQLDLLVGKDGGKTYFRRIYIGTRYPAGEQVVGKGDRIGEN
jgi:hypothetical protein